MKQFAIMCTVSQETEVYVDADNLLEAMEKLARGEIVCYNTEAKEHFAPLEFIKPQVWCDEAQDFVPCNVIMFPVKGEVTNEEEMEFDWVG